MLTCFNGRLKKVLKEATTVIDFEAEAFLMTIMRLEIFERNLFQFSSPTILHSFMSMLLNGPHMKDQHDQNS